SFNVIANGDSPLAFKWQRKPVSSTNWSDLINSLPYLGTTTSNLTILSVTMTMDGDQYRCVVTTDGGIVTSIPALLTVISPSPPEVVLQPLSQSAKVGVFISF